MGYESKRRRSARARRARPIRAWVSAGVLAGAGGLLFACAQESSPVGPGGECFLASDCQAGLVCVPQPNGARACSSDLTGFEGNPPAEAGGDTAVPGDAPDDSPQDTSVVTDTGADTGIADSGADG